MKKVGLSDTVLAEMWRKLRVARVNSAFFAVSFLARKSELNACRNWKEISRLCGRVGVSYKGGDRYILFTRALRPS